MEDKVFVDGMIVKAPHENAPDFVICNLSLKGKELVDFLRTHHKDGWVNVQVKRSKGGKLYAELDTWQPTQGEQGTRGMEQARAAAEPTDFADLESDIPF